MKSIKQKLLTLGLTSAMFLSAPLVSADPFDEEDDTQTEQVIDNKDEDKVDDMDNMDEVDEEDDFDVDEDTDDVDDMDTDEDEDIDEIDNEESEGDTEDKEPISDTEAKPEKEEKSGIKKALTGKTGTIVLLSAGIVIFVIMKISDKKKGK